MIGGILEIAQNDRYLSKHRGFAVISDKDRELGRIPFGDLTAVILSGHQITVSTSILGAFMDNGVTVVTCGGNCHPEGMMLPVSGHHRQAGILREQIGLSEPRRKRLWQNIIRVKIEHQSLILAAHGSENSKAGALKQLAKRVKSGDPDNLEAQAARLYWPDLMGRDFRRKTDMPGLNGFLNYGYAVLRAATARAVVAAGLAPSMGLNHRSQLNGFALVDDLMEPYRPLVDSCVRALRLELSTDRSDAPPELTPDIKRALVAVLRRDCLGEKGMSPLANCLHVMARSLVSCLTDKDVNLVIPGLPPPDRLL